MSQKAERMAYDAGRALPRINWLEDATDKQRELGEHHNPFDKDRQPDEYAAWLRGLRDAIEEQAQADPKALLKRIDDEVRAVDRVR